jgi:hypothetical protein
MSLFDYALFVDASIKDLYISKGINWGFWEIGYEEYVEKSLARVPSYDVIFLGNEYSLHRSKLGHMLRGLNCKVGIYGSWKSVKPDGENMYDFADADALYRNAKIVISDAQYPQCIAYVSNRLFQALHAGAFVLQQKMQGMTKYLGLEEGVHLATWDDIDDIPGKVAFWLGRDAERLAIAKVGKEHNDLHYSFAARVTELNRIIAPKLVKIAPK